MLSFEWGTVAESEVQGKVKKLMGCLCPLLDLRRVYHITDPDVQAEYVLRGFICYYGRHYFAYFYSTTEDQWLLYDDAVVKVIICLITIHARKSAASAT